MKVAAFRNSCFFCRKCGEEFGLKEMVPAGFCPDLFFQIYPVYLSLLYNGKPGKDMVLISCPGNGAKTYWRIRAKKLWVSWLINIADKIFRAIGQPKDFFDSKVVAELVKTEGFCPRGYKGKIKFSFNQYSHLWGRRFFCPAVFYTLYPFLVSSQKQDEVSLQCPADYTSIVFKIVEENV